MVFARVRARACALCRMFTNRYNLVVDIALNGVIIGAWEAIGQPIQHRINMETINVIFVAINP